VINPPPALADHPTEFVSIQEAVAITLPWVVTCTVVPRYCTHEEQIADARQFSELLVTCTEEVTSGSPRQLRDPIGMGKQLLECRNSSKRCHAQCSCLR
jgi:hypothetical protein